MPEKIYLSVKSSLAAILDAAVIHDFHDPHDIVTISEQIPSTKREAIHELISK
jgi:hypothetical protein